MPPARPAGPGAGPPLPSTCAFLSVDLQVCTVALLPSPQAIKMGEGVRLPLNLIHQKHN